MTLQLKSIDQEKRVALFETEHSLFAVSYFCDPETGFIVVDRENENNPKIKSLIVNHIKSAPKPPTHLINHCQ